MNTEIEQSQVSMGGRFLVVGAVIAMVGVALGAFGAHALKKLLSPEMLVVYETGVRYHMYHAFGVLVAGWGLVTYHFHWFRYAAWAFIFGTLLFSGSLYWLSWTGIRGFGAVTPLGGVLFLMGWIFLAVGFWKVSRQSSK
jgi:uncharacterized membrane protein YgdD (TMEM256/DUF423 family)